MRVTPRVKCKSRGWIFPVLLCFSLVVHAGGASAATLDDDFVLENFTSEDGLPGNTIRNIDQTADGYLWLSVSGGLARFDGVRFTLFDGSNTPELSHHDLENMHVDQRGILWIFSGGKRISIYQNGKFTAAPGTKELPDRDWYFNGEPPDGRLMIEASDGSHRSFEADRFVAGADRFKFGSTLPAPLWADRSGLLWWLDGAHWRRVTYQDLGRFLPEAHPNAPSVTAVRSGRNGGLWALSDRRLFWRNKGEWKIFPSPSQIAEPTSMVEDSQGNVWIGTWSQGLWRFKTNGQFQPYPLTRGKQPEAVRSLFEDREGNLWLGTEGSGLFRIKPRLFHTYSVPDGLSGEMIRSVTSGSDGRVWVMNQSGLDELRPGLAPARHIEDLGLGWCVFADRQNRLWTGTYEGALRSYDETGRHEWRARPVPQTEAITCFFQDKEDVIWIGSSDGLLQVEKDSLRRIEKPSTRFDVRALAEDGRGTLYAGTRRDGVWAYEKKAWRRLGGSAEQRDLPVRSLFADRGGVLWIGTENRGLWRFKKGGFFQFGKEGSLPVCVNSIVEDELGSLWLGSNQGLFRIGLHDLNEVADGKSKELETIRYTKTDGLRTTETTGGRQPTACKTADGRLWFATVKGVSVVSPTAISPNRNPPSVLIESVKFIGPPSEIAKADRAENAVERAHEREARVPAGNRQIEIQYTATSFTAPERVRFRYQMEGADEGWVEAGTRRIAYYHGLLPGKYRFRVIASNSDGAWSAADASMPFVILPFFWQTVWFKLLMAGSTAAVACVAYRWRVAQITAMVRLRGRIAGDLHDEIGGNLGSIGLNADILRAAGGLSRQQSTDLEGIAKLTALTAQAVRDVVWFVNPDFDNSAGMLLRMRELAALMLAGKTWTFDAPESGPSRSLELEFRRNVFFIFKECLHNIVKHSNAGSVQIRAVLEADRLRLQVEDDGIGFDPAVEGSGSGARNLRRRAAELNGTLRIVTAKGQGTRVMLEAPLSKRKPRWTWLRARPPENS